MNFSFLERTIRRAVSRGVGDAVGKAVQKAVEPVATDIANKAANQINQTAQTTAQQINQTTGQMSQTTAQATTQATGGLASLEGALGNLQRSMEGYVTEVAKNMKICPSCNEPCSSDKKFCPKCGTKLPEQTIAQGSVCPNCGKQNTVGTKFCSDCGTKLPSAVQEEDAKKSKDMAVLTEWEQKLAVYPKWNCGGTDLVIDQNDDTTYMFCAKFASNTAAQEAVKNYRILLQQNGFTTAGQYKTVKHLYKKVNDVCYHVDTEHCFDGDSDCPTIYFLVGEPYGGF